MGDSFRRSQRISARANADQHELQIGIVKEQIEGLTLLLRRLQRDHAKWRKGAAGEEKVADLLEAMSAQDWLTLVDRKWPGTRNANIDLIVVGPGGVFVIDVKQWNDVTIADGHIAHGQADEYDAVANVEQQADAVANVLSEAGLPPGEVRPVLVFVGKRLNVEMGRTTAIGEDQLLALLTRAGLRLRREQVLHLATALDSACPPAGTRTQPVADGTVVATAHRKTETASATTTLADEASDLTLVSEDEVIEAVRQAAEQGSIEQWMTWLHPSQAKLVAQQWNGPARVRGPAGTGKSVVALHRAKYLAERGRSVVFTSFVKTLPNVQASLFERLAPRHATRVRFQGVHSLAMSVLSSSGKRFDLDQAAIDTCFNRAWLSVGRTSRLGQLQAPREYWRDEIDAVIKARGLTNLEDYLKADRRGRNTPLQQAHREAVFALYVRYEDLLAERAVWDWNDVLRHALDEVETNGAPFDVDAVIVDEVQDLNPIGLRFLDALTGHRPDGILLVGDGQQAVYPGGFTLAEAGLSVAGRSSVLRRNYRNGAAIVEAALQVVAADGFDDLEAELQNAADAIETDRQGGTIHTHRARDEETMVAAVVEHLREAQRLGQRLGDRAILVASNTASTTWMRALRNSGIPAVSLYDYDGRTIEAVKVGTFHRAKGLEFASVYVPHVESVPAPRRQDESDDCFVERSALERRQLFVGMTRARDELWLGYVEREPAILRPASIQVLTA
jgi:hypothetical protein